MVACSYRRRRLETAYMGILKLTISVCRDNIIIIFLLVNKKNLFAEYTVNVTEHTLRFYADKGLLPCERHGGNRRVFNEESVNWMQGIKCLKGCGASIEDIKEYCRLCLLEESEENLRAMYAIILKQRDAAYSRMEEAKATAKYMDDKVVHYENILSGIAPDDTNPKNWTAENRPKH